MIHYHLLRAWLDTRIRTAHADERGASLVEFLIVTVAIAAVALVVVALYTNVINDKSAQINLG